MDSYQYSELIKELSSKVENIAKIIKPQELRQELEDIATQELYPKFWHNAKRAG